jgi:hypothetical protein
VKVWACAVKPATSANNMVKTIWIRLYLRIGFGVVSVEGRLLNLLIFIEIGMLAKEQEHRLRVVYFSKAPVFG